MEDCLGLGSAGHHTCAGQVGADYGGLQGLRDCRHMFALPVSLLVTHLLKRLPKLVLDHWLDEPMQAGSLQSTQLLKCIWVLCGLTGWKAGWCIWVLGMDGWLDWVTAGHTPGAQLVGLGMEGCLGWVTADHTTGKVHLGARYGWLD